MTAKDQNLTVECLYDHYKDSYTFIKKAEDDRNKNFIILIALIGLLYFCVSYTECAILTLNEIEVPSILKINISSVPFKIIISILWTYILIKVISYYQLCSWINRQYEYLHKLEIELSKAFEADYFSREGLSYKNEFPIFLDWVWILYTFIFPVVFLATIGRIIYLERMCSLNFNFIYDEIFGYFIFITVILFKLKVQTKIEPCKK